MASVSATRMSFQLPLKINQKQETLRERVSVYSESHRKTVNKEANECDKDSLKKLLHSTKVTRRCSSLKFLSGRLSKSGFPVLRTSQFRVSCAAKPETVDKVCEIVRRQLALSPESVLTPESAFSALGADSLDTVEIVMSLEEEFGISIEEENSQNITTVQDAADLIEELVEGKS